ncbi:MAG: small multi-drug export protein [Thermoplasmatota archaeon]
MTDAHPLHPPHPGHIPLPEEAPPRQPPPRVVRAFPLVGACIAGLVLVALLEIYLGQRSQFLPALISVGTLYTAGKEGGIPLGIAAGGEPMMVALLIFGTDLAMTLLLYPLVHAAFDGVQRRKGILGSMLRTAQNNANKRRKVVDRYGALGLYAFMLVPFAFNSPLVGIALGRIAQLTPLRTMLVVASAIATTTTLWTILVVYGFGQVLHVSPWVPVTVSLTVTASVFTWGYLAARKERREEEGKKAATKI